MIVFVPEDQNGRRRINEIRPMAIRFSSVLTTRDLKYLVTSGALELMDKYESFLLFTMTIFRNKKLNRF